MEELYIETENGKFKLDEEIIKKYNIRMGTKSPFNGYRIVGPNNEYPELAEDGKGEEKEDHNLETEYGMVDLDNDIVMSQSEMIDIARGTDGTGSDR